MIDYPTTIDGWEGFAIEAVAEIAVERGFIDQWLEAMRDGNPLYWNEETAKELCGGVIAPPPMTLPFSMSFRWSPRRPEALWDMYGREGAGRPAPLRMPMEPHFALKTFTGLKEGIVGGIDSEFHEPLRIGDRLTMRSSIKDIGPERTNKLGTGRNWTCEVRYANQCCQWVSTDRYRFFCYNRT